MGEHSDYMETIIGKRAQMLSQEEQLHGDGSLSLETLDMGAVDSFSYINAHFAEFLEQIRGLGSHAQELLLTYYCLHKTQTAMATMFCETQTGMSYTIRLYLGVMCAFILFGVRPPADVMRPILVGAGVEGAAPGLSLLIEEYEAHRSFEVLANKYRQHRPLVRRRMTDAANQLFKSANSRERALGYYLLALMYKASAREFGLSRRQRKKNATLCYKEPEILGQFKIDLNDPTAKFLFSPRGEL
jgi:hypothetical protein